MLPNIDSISRLRKKLGITQKKLAQMAEVSTSMINQIESGRSKPSYNTAKRIFDSMAELEGKTSRHNAGDCCSKDIVMLGSENTIFDAIKIMRKHSISQIPIFDDKLVGVISEDSIIKHHDDEADPKKSTLKEFMETVPPVVNHDTPVNALTPLILVTKCVLVTKDSKIIGIITASDILRLAE